MRAPTLAIAIVTTLIVSLVVFVDSARPSPGPLSAVHAREARLAGNAGCVLCHGTTGQSLADACLQCHTHQAQQIATRRGLHGRLGDAVQACGRCHGEHHGTDFAQVARSTFARAGVDDPARFDHAGLDYDLSGVHGWLPCTTCHQGADCARLPRGGQRYAGLDDACQSCHRDPHAGKLPNCTECHGQDHPFALVSEFAHTPAFALVGAHDNLACRRCHALGTAYAIENLGREANRPGAAHTVRGCTACHAQPHDADFLSRAATGVPPEPPIAHFVGRLLGFEVATPAAESKPAVDVDSTCERCHPDVRGGFLHPTARMEPASHAHTGFTLALPHAEVACAKCHAERPAGAPHDGSTFAVRHPGRSVDDCAACHRDPHDGQFAPALGTTPDCLACHERHAFAPATFDRAQHAHTRMPLLGAHADVACHACHRDPPDGSAAARQFRDTPRACMACHRDPHAGQFAGADGTDCAHCHTQASFRPAQFDVSAHDGTAFPLTGAHAAVACAGCHAAPAKDTPCRFRGLDTACSSCHADVHAGRFDRTPGQRVVAERPGCARCHGTEGFRPLTHPFDHDLFTDYPLRGRHRAAQCGACHVGAQRDRAGMAAAPARCEECHRDPHAGQFAVQQRTDCARCHTEEGTFRNVRFDHARTRFPLDDQHARLPCASCHRAYDAQGTAIVRYRPLGTRCADCHGPVAPERRGR